MGIKQKMLRTILDVFGLIYISIEKYVEYPNDKKILGMDIDDDLHKMSRQQLCRYMDAVLPEKGFFDIQSTSKIRLGCQLLRNFHLLKKELKQNDIVECGHCNRNDGTCGCGNKPDCNIGCEIESNDEISN